MFQENLIFYGKYSDYMDNLIELDIFERMIDIALLSINIGILFDKKEKNESSSKKKEIFASTISNESENFKMLAITAYLKNVDVETIEHDQLMIDLFIDLENSSKFDDKKRCLKKYEYLKEYLYGGLEFLNNVVCANAYDKIDKIKNLERFLDQIGQITNKGSTRIIESLLS